jgi:hypothetical protein
VADDWEEAERKHAGARVLAPALVGLPTHDAVSRAEREGFTTQVVRGVMTAELALGRIRLVEDADGVVVRAWAG